MWRRLMTPTRLVAAWQRTTIVVTVVPLVVLGIIGHGQHPANTVVAACLVIGGSTHVAATGWFVFETDVRSVARRRWCRFFLLPAAVVAAAAWFGATASPHRIAIFLCGFFAWQFFHFQKQNVGVAALMASSSKVASLTTRERRCLVASGIAGITGLLGRPSLLHIPLRPATPALFFVGEVLFVVALVMGVAALMRRYRDQRSLVFVVTYVSGLLFNAPIFLFRAPYAAVGGMTVAHGFQYLFIVSTVVGASVHGRRRWERATLFSNILIVGTGCLAVAIHLHDGDGFERAIYGVALGVTMAHFLIDAAIWRLRDPQSRKFLTRRLPHLLGDSPTTSIITSPADIG